MVKVQFVKGAIPTTLMQEIIDEISGNKNEGAINIFIGQVRADRVNQTSVKSIEYEIHKSMAMKEMKKILKLITEKYEINKIIVIHSEGIVPSGKWSLLVACTAPHRQQAISATKAFIDLMKKQVPIWKKELLENGEHRWISS